MARSSNINNVRLAEIDLGTDARPSKTQKKNEAHDLQALGRDLSELSADQLASLPLDEGMRIAIDELRRTRSHEGRRRQLQYVGKLMRRTDAEPLREALNAIKLGHAQDSLALHQAEYWREALVADDAALTRFVSEHPGVDTQALRTLVRRARDERAKQLALPTGETRHGKSWRELFKLIKPVVMPAAATKADAADLEPDLETDIKPERA